MGALTVSSTISGTLDGVTYGQTGTTTREITGCLAESVDLTTAFTEIQMPQSPGKTLRALVYNEGATEIKVRIERVASTTWHYHNIPAGATVEIFDSEGSAIDSNIISIAVRTMSGTGRAVVLQAWI